MSDERLYDRVLSVHDEYAKRYSAKYGDGWREKLTRDEREDFAWNVKLAVVADGGRVLSLDQINEWFRGAGDR
ncbi:hypothetical protein FOS14_18815 [Skermania sp. ID1734]|uniref:hypothetical protein n=1 Tax=Skermania sp. ID1734 TaxID=2597516 RepID=UPI00117E19DC|nr:hypothetical protein [Skermania sp. ID1734]TSD95047.1 hypothetical protein FOS14_18815 [Skermania sp. ID1734]